MTRERKIIGGLRVALSEAILALDDGDTAQERKRAREIIWPVLGRIGASETESDEEAIRLFQSAE